MCHVIECGDGLLDGAEECDDGPLNIDFLPDHCRTNCTLPTCGDGVEDTLSVVNGVLVNEICDNGPLNGLPGMCASDCSGVEEMLASEAALTATPPPFDTVGLLLTDSYGLAMCIEAPSSDFFFRDVYWDAYAHYAGRLITLATDHVFQNPVLFFDDGEALANGDPMLVMEGSMTEPLYGTFAVPAGSTVVVSPVGLPLATECCGTLGSRTFIGCAVGPLDPPGGINPPCGAPYKGGPLRGSCPVWSPTDAFVLNKPAYIDAVQGTPSSTEPSCGSACFVAGGPGICTGGPTFEPVPERIPCSTVGAPDVDRACQQMGGDWSACVCSSNPGDQCMTINPTVGMNPGTAKDCWIKYDESCYDIDRDNPQDPSTSLQVLVATCMKDPGHPDCADFRPPGSLDVDLLVCGFENEMCAACDRRAAGVCLPVIDDIGGTQTPAAIAQAACSVGACLEGSPQQAVNMTYRRTVGDPRLMTKTADPVVVATGELTLNPVDVTFPSRGVPFELRRHYRSGGMRSGALGAGWNHAYEERIVPIGDPTNRIGAPDYCTVDLPLVNCLSRTNEYGAVELWVRDPEKKTVFMPPPGAVGTITVRRPTGEFARAREVLNLKDDHGGYVIEHLGPGGIRRTYDISGVLLTVTDEMGYGLALQYREKTRAELIEEGAWTNAEHPAIRPTTYSQEAAQASSDRVNRLNAKELTAVTDAYGRRFEFTYETFFPTLTSGGGKVRRRRLVAIEHRGEDLVRYDYATLDLTTMNEAYLNTVTRRGFLPNGQDSAATVAVVNYEYDHNVFLAGEALSDSVIAQASIAYSGERVACGGSTVARSPDIGDACGHLEVDTNPGGTVDTADEYRNLVRRIVADNIVRVWVDGEIELETRYDIDPGSETFDMAVAQRYGQVPRLLATPEDLFDGNGRRVHTWLTAHPEHTLESMPGDAAVPTGLNLLVASHDPSDEPLGLNLPLACGFGALQSLPYFNPQAPVGARSDGQATVKRTAASCEQLAGRWAKHHDPTQLMAANLFPLRYANEATTASERVGDLNLICQWVKETDRRGVVHWHGLNFEGVALLEGHPSPNSTTGTTLSVTAQRVDASGNVVEVTGADGGKVSFEYGESSTPALTRHLVTRMTETAASGSGLVAARNEVLSTPSTVLTTRETTLAYEPLYQQLASITTPDGVQQRFKYDYQQSHSASAAFERRRTYFEHQTATEALIDVDYVDYDGDGERAGELSAGVVLAYVAGVDLGGSISADVGTRSTRDQTGRVVESFSIRDAGDESLDFDRTTYVYYENLAKAEAGNLTIGVCRTPCGPLGKVTSYRTPTASAADDLNTVFYAYDRYGGVRLERRNDDTSTDVVTTRDHLGRTLEVELPDGEVRAYDTEPSGNVRFTVATDGADSVVTANAWGLGDKLIGTCGELSPGACDDFQVFAEQVVQAVQDNTSLPAPLPNADYTVSVADVDDGPLATVGPFGLESKVIQRLPAGQVAAETAFGSPNQVHSFAYDVMGRTLRSSVGVSAASPSMRTQYRYDRFGRLVDRRTRMALSSTAFSASSGTIESVGYDIVDRVTRESVLGSLGSGRGVLQASRAEYNAVGMPLHIHDLADAQSTSSTVPGVVSGGSGTDAYASRHFRFDSAGRLLRADADGIGISSAALYDDFGMTQLTSPGISLRSVTTVPRQRLVTESTTWRLEGVGSTESRTVETHFTARGLPEKTYVNESRTPTVQRLTQRVYTGLGRLQAVVDPSQRISTFVYDPLGRLTSREIGAGTPEQRTISYNHDARGRVVLTTPSDGPSTSYTYDVAGRLVTESSLDMIKDIDRDAAGRVTAVTEDVRNVARTRSFTYATNSTAVLKLKVDGTTVVSSKYDGLDRPYLREDANVVLNTDSASSTFRSSRPQIESNFTYDRLGRVVSELTTANFPSTSPTSPGQGYVIASQGRSYAKTFAGVSNITHLSGETTFFAYSSGGFLAQKVREGADGTEVPLAFSSLGGLWTEAKEENTKVAVFKNRDGLGQVIASGLADTDGDKVREDVLRGPTGRVVASRIETPTFGQRLRSHAYDGLGRLQTTRIDLNTSLSAAAFAAQRSTVAAVESTNPVSSPDAVMPYSHGQADTLTNVGTDEHGRQFSAAYDTNQTGVPPTDINGRTIARDDFDRIEHDDKLTYTYDALGRLALVERAGNEELRVSYDGAGRRRLERRLEPKEGMLDLVLEYEGANVVEENKATDPGTIVFQTVHGPGEDVPLVTVHGPLKSGGKAPIMLGSNVRGDVVMAYDLNKLEIVEEQQLDDYGERETDGCIEGKEDGVASLPESSCSLGYLGRYGIAGARQHMGTKLVDLRNRVYATHLRGFLTKDPMGNVDSEGRWNYVAADPVNLRDPWGLQAADGEPVGNFDDDMSGCEAGDPAACDRVNKACDDGADQTSCGYSNNEETVVRRYRAGGSAPKQKQICVAECIAGGAVAAGGVAASGPGPSTAPGAQAPGTSGPPKAAPSNLPPNRKVAPSGGRMNPVRKPKVGSPARLPQVPFIGPFRRLLRVLGPLTFFLADETTSGDDDPEARKIPEEWGPPRPNHKGKPGRRWENPENQGDGVRIDPAVPESPFPSQQVPHVIVRKGGVVIGRDGKPIKGSIRHDPENAHIPVGDWLTWRIWYEP